MNGTKNLENQDVTVLIVDDDADLVRGTVLVLQKAGFKTLSAGGGVEALGLLADKSPADLPDIVLLDWGMPGMDGLEVCRCIKADPRFATTVVVMTSGTFTSPAQQRQGLSTGADGFISRPVASVDLLARMAAFADVARLTRQLRAKNAELESAIAGLRERRLAELNLLEDAVAERKRGGASLATLRENEEIFSRFMENSPIYVFFLDCNSRMLRLSRNFETLVGESLAEQLGKSMDELFPSDLARKLVEDDKRVFAEGRTITAEEEFNGRRYSTTKFPIFVDGEPRYLAGYAIDITEQAAAAKKLADSEALYRSVVSAIGEGLTLQDENAAILEFNEAATTILGLTADQLRGKTSFDPLWRAVHEDGTPFPGETHPVPVALKTGLPQTDVMMGIHKPDGTLAWIAVNALPLFRKGEAKPYRVVATMHDMTERKRAEAELRASERRLRDTLDQLMEGCLILDFNWTCLYANGALARHGRQQVANLIGRNWLDIYPGFGNSEVFAGYQRVMKERMPLKFESRFRFDNGETAWFEIHITPVSQGIFVMTHEITEQKGAAQRDAALLELEMAAGTLEEKALLQMGLDSLEKLTQSRIGFLHFVNEGQDEISLITWTTDTMASCHVSYDSHYPVSSAGVWADSIREKRPVIVNDYAAAPNKKGLPEGHAHLQRFVSVPVLQGGLVRMIVGVGNATRNYDQKDVDTISRFSSEMYRVVTGRRAERLSADTAEQYRSIMENSADAIITTDAAGIIIRWNPAATRVFGYAEAEALGQSMDFIAPERYRAEYQAGLERLRQGQQSRLKGQVAEYHGLRQDGAEFPLEISLNAGQTSTGLFITVSIRDISARKLAEAALNTAEAKFRGIVEQTMVGVYILDGEKIIYANPRAAEIFCLASEKITDVPLLPLIAEADRELMAMAIESIDMAEAEVARVEYAVKRDDGIEVIVGTELRRVELDGKLVKIGVLQDVTSRVRSERQMRDYTARLERAVLGTVDAVARMMDMRDPYTAGHERRVGELAALIAAEMGLSENVQQGLRIAGGVHDVGKITVPAEILGKPGKISAVEFEIIKTHAEQGYEVLKGVDFPWPVAEVARQHHERVDGSGYPRGLKGDQIILEARILAVADVVEAMATHRPYRPAQGIAKALDEITRGAGTAFDPPVVDACLKLFREKGYQFPDI